MRKLDLPSTDLGKHFLHSITLLSLIVSMIQLHACEMSRRNPKLLPSVVRTKGILYVVEFYGALDSQTETKSHFWPLLQK